MTTVLFYLVIAAVIGLVVFFLAVLVFGRGEQMAPLDPRTSPAELPDHDIDSADVRKVRFALALRGYRMSDVDWTLERLGEQVDSLRLENAHLRDRLSPLDHSEPPQNSEVVEDPDLPDGQVVSDPSAVPDAVDWEAADPPGAAQERQRWDRPQSSWPADQPEAAERPPQPDQQERYAERSPTPAVDR